MRRYCWLARSVTPGRAINNKGVLFSNNQPLAQVASSWLEHGWLVVVCLASHPPQSPSCPQPDPPPQMTTAKEDANVTLDSAKVGRLGEKETGPHKLRRSFQRQTPHQRPTMAFEEQIAQDSRTRINAARLRLAPLCGTVNLCRFRLLHRHCSP